MRHLLILLTVLAPPSSAFGAGVEAYIQWSDFLAGYGHEVLIRDTTVVHIHRRAGERTPDWNVSVLDASEIDAFVDKLAALGADNWAQRYPDQPNICDGLSYFIDVEAPTLSINTEGGCVFPPRFDEMLDATKKLVKFRD